MFNFNATNGLYSYFSFCSFLIYSCFSSAFFDDYNFYVYKLNSLISIWWLRTLSAFSYYNPLFSRIDFLSGLALNGPISLIFCIWISSVVRCLSSGSIDFLWTLDAILSKGNSYFLTIFYWLFIKPSDGLPWLKILWYCSVALVISSFLNYSCTLLYSLCCFSFSCCFKSLFFLMSSISRSSEDNLSDRVEGASDDIKLDLFWVLSAYLSPLLTNPKWPNTMLLLLHDDLAVDCCSSSLLLFLPNVQSFNPMNSCWLCSRLGWSGINPSVN